MASKFQLTLAILKPDLVHIPYNLKEVRRMILGNDFIFVRSRIFPMKRRDAEAFYAEHEGRFFYNRLVTYMSSGTSHIHILAKENAISEWRALMGPTKVMKTKYEHPDTIRGKFGLTDTRNSTHGSDSDKSAAKEIGFFFPEFDLEDFQLNDLPRYEKCFENKTLLFDGDKIEHHLPS